MKPWWIKKAVMMFTFFLVAVTVFGLIVMLLWNALIPDLFNGPSLTFWQALGLVVLSHILLRGSGHWRYSNGWRHEHWRRKFEQKLAAMTPEEREKFKEEWEHRCGPRWGEHADAAAQTKT
jgi:ABC-type multidrug transport system fused ATPase/permease subunit